MVVSVMKTRKLSVIYSFVQMRFTGSFDALRSQWCWIMNPDRGSSQRTFCQQSLSFASGVDLGGESRGCIRPSTSPRDDFKLSNTTGILSVEVEHETRLKIYVKRRENGS